MKEESTKVADIFEKDINKLCDDINLVIQAHNKLVDENENLKMKIDKAIEMLNELNIKLKDILKIEINIKDISDIKQVLGDKENE